MDSFELKEIQHVSAYIYTFLWGNEFDVWFYETC